MGLLTSIPKFFDLFKEGEEVADPKTWKNRTVATNALVAMIGTFIALTSSFGYHLGLDSETIQDLAAGIVAAVGVFNAVMHVITSKKVGVPSDTGVSSGS